MEWSELALDFLWRNALGVIPLAIGVGALTRLLPLRASTRHALWVAALVGFLAPPLLPGLIALRPPTAAEVALGAPGAAPERGASPVDEAPVAEAQLTIEPARRLAARAPAPVEPRVLTTRLPGAAALPDGLLGASRDALTSAPNADAPARRSDAGRRSPLATPLPLAARPAERAQGDAPADARSGGSSPAESGGQAGAARDGGAPFGVESARQWGVTLLALREALVATPRVPAQVWLLGAAAALVIGVGRVWWFHRLLARGSAADEASERMVREASERLGLRRRPATVLVDERITPMVWCGRRARLVLPRPLWEDLDEVGRAAVVHHELAHLKRRDHWVCWLEAAIGLVYWWHPVAWWVRRRIRDEADLCCDAWVIALMPQHRRAYAQALVSTRRYISEHGSAPPVVGLGVMSTRGKRFARRLLMIMTNSQKPRLSTTGRAMALAVLVAGVIAAPALACPPDDKEMKAKEKAAPAPSRAKADAPGAKGESKPAKATDERSTFERYMEGREGSGPEGMSYAPAAPGGARGAGGAVGAAPARQSSLAALEARVAGPPKETKSAPSRAVRPAPAPGAGVGAGPGEGASTYERWAQGEAQIVRKYTLSDEEKLERLLALLVRDDVPLRVRPEDDGVTVIGVQAQHDRFSAFVRLIDGEGEVERIYALPEGRLDALTELMALDSVPLLVRPEDEGLRVWGNELEQLIFAGFIELLTDGAPGEAPAVIIESERRDADRDDDDDDDCSPSRARVLSSQANAEQRDAARREAEIEREAARQLAQTEREAARRQAQTERELARRQQALERDLARLHGDAGRLEQRAAQIESQAQAFEQQADAFEAQADAMEQQADAIESEADRLEAGAESMEDERAAEDLVAEAEKMRVQAERIREQAESVRDRAEGIRDRAEEARDRADEVREEAEEAHERAENLADEHEEAVAQLLEGDSSR